MLESVLDTISQSDVIEKTIIVSRDETALGIGKKFGAIQIYDTKELGVNNAVLLGDNYYAKESFDATLVLPQDIPLVQTQITKHYFKLETLREGFLFFHQES